METLQWIRELVSIAAGLAVIVGVGWGLKLARQIVKTKDATIEQKEATIKYLEKLQSAPLATELQTVTATVNKYVGKSQELEVQLKTMKEQHKNVVGVVCFEAFLAIEEMRYAYQSAAGGFDALALPSKMRSLAEEFLEQGQQAFAGQAIQARRVREAMARQKS